MKRNILSALCLLVATSVGAQSLRFDFTNTKKVREGHTRITAADRYTPERGYGYDLQSSPEAGSKAPFFFSVDVPDGNYLVTAVIGNHRAAGETPCAANHAAFSTKTSRRSGAN